jgi:hypothetical protein
VKEQANTPVADDASPAAESSSPYTPEEEAAIDDLAGQFNYPQAIAMVVGQRQATKGVSETSSDKATSADEELGVSESPNQTSRPPRSASRGRKKDGTPDRRTLGWRGQLIADKVVTDALGRKVVL